MKRIVVFGGTGMTGKCIVAHALSKGATVRVLIRSEKTVPEDFGDKVELVKGDATNLEDVKAAIKDMDGVCVALGTRNKLEPTNELSISTANIVKAMEESTVRKLSVCLSSFLFWDDEKVPKMFEHLHAEHKKMLDIVKQSNLDYVAVMPPHIADEPSGQFQVLHDQSPGRTISKYDLGKFMFDCLEQEEHKRMVCGIATIKSD